MKRFRKILVAVEPSSVVAQFGDELTGPSRHALARAIWLTSQTRGELTIFSTVAVAPFIDDLLREQLAEGGDEPTQATIGLLERCVAQAKQEGVEAKFALSSGVPWQEICRHVQAEQYDVVIAGTRDLGRVSRLLFGSTGMKLLHNCPAPVWITRPDPHNEQFQILVPTDFSEASLEALRMALELGRLGHGRLHLLHVPEDPLGLPAWYARARPEMVQEYIAKRKAQSKKRLHDQLRETGDQSFAAGVHVHVAEGPPDEAILQAIDDLHINLVVMGTAARAGVARVVLGNTAERLFSHLKCSLVAVKPPGFQSPVSAGSDVAAHV